MFILQTTSSALSDMIDPSERKVSEFPSVGEMLEVKNSSASESSIETDLLSGFANCDDLTIGKNTYDIVIGRSWRRVL